MLLNLTEYHRPAALAEALALLARDPEHTAPLAGGTYLLGQRNDMVQALVDLCDLGLDRIDVDPGSGVGINPGPSGPGYGTDLSSQPPICTLALKGQGTDRGIHARSSTDRGEMKIIRLGAMATLQALATHPLLQEAVAGIVAQAAQRSATRLIRNAATLGGTLATGAAALADLPTALLALDAWVSCRGADLAAQPGDPGSAQMGSIDSSLPGGDPGPEAPVYRAREVIRAYADIVSCPAQPGELITEVSFRRPVNARAAFLRASRTPLDVALVNVAAVVEFEEPHPNGEAVPTRNGRGAVRRIRVAMGGAEMNPVRLTAIEEELTGQAITLVEGSAAGDIIAGAVSAAFAGELPPALAGAGDFLASNAYRREVGKRLVRRALERCLERADSGG